jgi:hypothetical protein
MPELRDNAFRIHAARCAKNLAALSFNVIAEEQAR